MSANDFWPYVFTPRTTPHHPVVLVVPPKSLVAVARADVVAPCFYGTSLVSEYLVYRYQVRIRIVYVALPRNTLRPPNVFKTRALACYVNGPQDPQEARSDMMEAGGARATSGRPSLSALLATGTPLSQRVHSRSSLAGSIWNDQKNEDD